VSEAADVTWNDLQLVPPRQVRLRGKGRKERLLPLWRDTANALHRLRGMSQPDHEPHVFRNRRHGQPLTRDGIAYILRKHVTAVAKTRPTLARQRVTPQVLRTAAQSRCCSRARMWR
jgi:integrase/recombinase XerD